MINKKIINKNGITLVDLVITIVVMLFLAGVSISFILRENRLFNKANNSSKMYLKEAVKEELQNEYVSIDIDRVSNAADREITIKVSNETNLLSKYDN